jgi:hypothetical protein
VLENGVAIHDAVHSTPSTRQLEAIPASWHTVENRRVFGHALLPALREDDALPLELDEGDQFRGNDGGPERWIFVQDFPGVGDVVVRAVPRGSVPVMYDDPPPGGNVSARMRFALPAAKRYTGNALGTSRAAPMPRYLQEDERVVARGTPSRRRSGTGSSGRAVPPPASTGRDRWCAGARPSSCRRPASPCPGSWW